MLKNQQDTAETRELKTTKSRTVRLDEAIIKELDKIKDDLKKQGIKDPSYSQIIHYILHKKRK